MPAKSDRAPTAGGDQGLDHTPTWARTYWGGALFWMMAMMLPIVVMIILDLFEWHTPARVALFGGLSLIVPFILSSLFLGRELGRLIPQAKDQA
jgi:L-lactate permease